MRKIYDRAKSLVFSTTARDTYILFMGNALSAFLGFVFVLFAARSLSVPDFGILSAIVNLMTITLAVADIGLTAGLVNFVSESYAKGEGHLVNKFVKSAFIIKFLVVLVFSIVLIIFSPLISPRLLATNNLFAGISAGVLVLSLFLWSFFPYVLQAKKNFLGSISIDLSYMASRLVFFFTLAAGGVTLYKVLGTYALGGVVAGVVGFILVGTSFFKEKVDVELRTKLLKFSGWLGVNRIISSVSGGLDIQMLAAIMGATATGLYSIPSRLASFIIVLSGSFSSVLATRLAGFGNRDAERAYLKKATLAMIGVTGGIIVWVILAKPFIMLLFGEKYLPSVKIFQALALATIPFILSTPSVSAIIYSIKNTKFVGLFAIFQAVFIFSANYFLIPKFGVFGPTITLGAINSILAIYSWTVVIRHYWK